MGCHFDRLSDELIVHLLQKLQPVAGKIICVKRWGNHEPGQRPLVEDDKFLLERPWIREKYANVTEFVHISRVSRRLHRLCKDPVLFQEVAIHGLVQLGTFRWLAARASKINTLKIDNIWGQNVSDFGTPSAQLSLEEAMEPHMLRERKYLEELEMFLKATEGGLLTIQLDRIHATYPKWALYLIGRHCPKLQSLSINITSWWSDSNEELQIALCALANGCPVVESFRCLASDVDDIDGISENGFTDKLVAVLAWAWPNLKAVTIAGVGVTLIGLMHLKKASKLETLELGFYPTEGYFDRAFSHEALRTISRSVKELRLWWGILQDVDPNLGLLLELCPNVEKLRIPVRNHTYGPDEVALAERQEAFKSYVTQAYPRINVEWT